MQGNSVIQLPSAPIEAGRIINIRHNIYSGTDRVRLNFFSKNRINRVLELEHEHTDNDCRMFYGNHSNYNNNWQNYNYSKNYEIFIISDYIYVYADHAIDKQISSKL